MWNVLRTVGAAAVLLYAFGPRPATAADADLKITVTNGADTQGEAGIQVRPAGQHNGDVIVSGRSGDDIKVPAGTYDVEVSYNDGAANKIVWFDKLALSGRVVKTVEIGMPVASLRMVITNGGTDVAGNGTFNVRPDGQHGADVIVSERSGGTVRVPAGKYSVDVGFSDGNASKTIWLDGLALSGKVSKTVEVGMKLADLRIVITNSGKDVAGNGMFNVRPNGKHDADVIASEHSGGTVRVPADSYSVDVRFNDGAANKTIWLDALSVTGKVDKTVEVGAALTDVTWHIVNRGKELGKDARYQIRPDGNHQGDVIAEGASGDPARLAAGTYDLDFLYTKGMVNKMVWLDHQSLKGKVDRTTDLAFNLAHPTVSATLNGADVGAKARIGIMNAGKTDEIGAIQGGEATDLESGRYDLAATMPGAEGTLRNAEIAGQPHLVVAMKTLQVAELKPGGPPPKTCTIEVYGVNFDFNKSTLRRDSEPVLRSVLQLFNTSPAFSAEVGGHTDNIGKPDYNMKLSEARAAAVKTWLVAQGVAADRVSSRGYGDTRPLVSNDTDANRFKNRRVELRRTHCT